MEGVGSEVSQKIRSAIKAKLVELGTYVDEELPDYIMVLVANKKTKDQMDDDLSLFLGHNTERFTSWLHHVLQKLNAAALLQVTSTAEEPKKKELEEKKKDKEEKKVDEKKREKVVEECKKVKEEEMQKNKERERIERKRKSSEKKKEKKEKKIKKQDASPTAKSTTEKRLPVEKVKPGVVQDTTMDEEHEAKDKEAKDVEDKDLHTKGTEIKEKVTEEKEVNKKEVKEIANKKMKPLFRTNKISSADIFRAEAGVEEEEGDVEEDLLVLRAEDELGLELEEEPTPRKSQTEVTNEAQKKIPEMRSTAKKDSKPEVEPKEKKTRISAKERLGAPLAPREKGSVLSRIGGVGSSRRIVNVRDETSGGSTRQEEVGGVTQAENSGLARVVSSAISSACRSVCILPGNTASGKKLEARVRPLMSREVVSGGSGSAAGKTSSRGHAGGRLTSRIETVNRENSTRILSVSGISSRSEAVRESNRSELTSRESNRSEFTLRENGRGEGGTRDTGRNETITRDLRSELLSKGNRSEGTVKDNTRSDSTNRPGSSRVVSAVGAVLKRSHSQVESDEEEYDPKKPQLGGMASKVEVAPRPRRPGAIQANTALILRAVADAHRSVTRPHSSSTTTHAPAAKTKGELFSRSYREREEARKKEGREHEGSETIEIDEQHLIRVADDQEQVRVRKIAITVPNAARKESERKLKENVIEDLKEEDIERPQVMEADSGKDIVQQQLMPSKLPLPDAVYNEEMEEVEEEEEVVEMTSVDELTPTTATIGEGPKFIVTLEGVEEEAELRERIESRISNTHVEEYIEEVEEWEEEEEDIVEADADIGEDIDPGSNDPAPGITTINTAPSAQTLAHTVGTKERCKYWPVCKSGEACLFHHPTITCKAFPACKFGDKCLFIHPNCMYDAACTRPGCPYTHASSRNFTMATGTAKIKCKFFPKCTNMSCPFLHPKACFYGTSCTQTGCPFTHPAIPTGARLKWVSPKVAAASSSTSASTKPSVSVSSSTKSIEEEK